MVTERQWIAFRYVFTDGLTYEQAAEKMGISKQAVSGLIKRIRNKYPDCVPDTKKPKTLRFDPTMEDQIKEIF